jgi:copper chaperone NosL
MVKKESFLITLVIGILLGACTVEPREVNFGQDACTHCKMIVVDQRYAAELVTDKGKVYIFDSIECLISYQTQHPDVGFAHIMVTPISTPAELKNASECMFLRTEALPSPMGAYLSAVLPENAELLKEKYNADLYTWEELNEVFDQIEY